MRILDPGAVINFEETFGDDVYKNSTKWFYNLLSQHSYDISQFDCNKLKQLNSNNCVELLRNTLDARNGIYGAFIRSLTAFIAGNYLTMENPSWIVRLKEASHTLRRILAR